MVKAIGGLMTLAVLAGCAHSKLEDCPPEGVLGRDVARLRTSHYRVELQSTGAAAQRFLPFALMSAYAYRDGEACHEREEDNPVPKGAAEELRAHLTAISPDSPWTLVPGLGLKDACEDERGMMFHVWKRESGDRIEVVIAFRGTSDYFKDWIYGNLWWFTRLYEDNQITRAREHAGRVIAHFKREAGSGKALRFVATGHSLGGGLAQHVLYAYPDDVLQAVAFSPSSVTGFAALSDDRQRKGCECRDELGAEARLMRIYESYEVLANLRIFHKVIFPPERHVQEIRFPFERTWNPIAAHNMRKLALNMNAAARARPATTAALPWHASRHPECTKALVEGQRQSCARGVPKDAWMVCPQ